MNQAFTESIILSACIRPRTLDYITQRLHGLDPISTLDFLRDMEKRNLIRCNEDLWLIEEHAKQEISDILEPNAHLYLKKYMGDFDVFKKPHPLDFEWRNTKRSINFLADLIAHSTDASDSILIFGMPTLFANFCERELPQKVTIVERNQAVISSLKELSHERCNVIEADLFKIEADRIGTYSIVLMDPPWYDAHFYQFVWLANRCLRASGRLFISIPPINTRPNIDSQRINWFTFCERQGLCIESLLAGRLEYAMPFFEWNATRIAGALTTPFWRKGDLAIFQKLKNKIDPRPDYKEEASYWREVEIDTCRIRVKIDSDSGPDNEEVTISPIVPTQIIASVSSRDERRKKANVWTSGNRIFLTNNPRRLFSILQFYKEHITPTSNDTKEIYDFIQMLVQMETAEHNNYLEWLYHEMERESI